MADKQTEELARVFRNEAIDKLLDSLGLDKTPTMREQAKTLVEALEVFAERNKKYGDLWKRYGWMGNLLHVSSKAARLEKVFWEGNGKGALIKGDWTEPGTQAKLEYDYDDALDLINYSAFFIRNLQDNNERGAH